MQYSGAQQINPLSKESKVPEIEPNEPSIMAGENESEVQPRVNEGSELKGEQERPNPLGQSELANEGNNTISQEQPETTTHNKGVGGLHISNLTQQLLPPKYKIKITIDAIRPKYIDYLKNCGEWDFEVYVQGKLVKLSGSNNPIHVCRETTYQFKDAEPAIVEIPDQVVESPTDYQPLSIATTGSQVDNCEPKPLPSELPEVQKILSDKGSTRPYYANAYQKIWKIASQISNGCTQTAYYHSCIPNCYGWNGVNNSYYYFGNHSLALLNIVNYSPGYGKIVPKSTAGNPESVHINTCKTFQGMFCLYYTIDCPLCSAIREH